MMCIIINELSSYLITVLIRHALLLNRTTSSALRNRTSKKSIQLLNLRVFISSSTNMLSDQDFTDLLDSFPPVSFAFAYGSGVIEQGGYNYIKNQKATDLPMVDMIFAVDDPVAWHTSNMKSHPTHYTPLFPLPPWMVAYIQESFGANIWFNALIPMKIKSYPDRLMKYGVISTEALIQDLSQWNHLYVAGRLHKPVRIILSNPEVTAALATNREHALRASLLLLPDLFSEIDLYYTIASLSYVGDPRMILGENPKKVVNLVNPIVPHYRSLYLDKLLNMIGPNKYDALKVVPLAIDDAKKHPSSSSVFIQKNSQEHRWQLCQKLPLNMRRLLMVQGRARYWRDTPPTRTAIRTALASIVAQAATSQSVKGLMTVGTMKVVSYMFSKVSKQLFARSDSMSKRGGISTSNSVSHRVS